MAELLFSGGNWVISCLVGCGYLVVQSGVYQVLSHAGWCVFVGCHLLWLHVCCHVGGVMWTIG